MGTNIVTKFRLNTDDFKVFFDNEKKTHVAENLETGEKTNIGVLGIFLQMGILQPEEETEKYSLVQRLGFLEDTVNSLAKDISQLKLEPVKQPKEDEEVKEESEEKSIKKKKLKFDVKEKIMERALEGMNNKENNVKEESEEEIENWGDI